MASTLKGIASYVHNPREYSHCFEDFTLFTTALNTPSLRNILTTVFVLVNIFIGLLWPWVLRERNMRRLLQHKSIPINHLTSTMSGDGALTYLFSTHLVPGGSLGFSLMLLTWALSLAHQYFVNSFILPVQVQTRCSFESGVVTNYSWSTPLGTPVSTWSAARTVYNAQYQVYLNGGLFGIYAKVDNNYTQFSPATEDVLGYWSCSTQKDTLIAQADWQNSASLDSFLEAQGFLFSNASSIERDYNYDDGTINGFLKWSANQQEISSQQTIVRASAAVNLAGLDATVTNLECQLTISQNSWTPPNLLSQDSLDEWVNTTFGELQTSSPNEFGLYIQWSLNAMVMVGGSGNNNRLQVSDSTYGCSVNGTKIMPEIWAIFGAMFLLCGLMVLAGIVAHLLHLFQHGHIARGDLVKDTPSSVQNWQLTLLKEVTGDESITLAQMRHYSYAWDEDARKYKLTKNVLPSAKINPATDQYP